ncbi:hypothetical protein [Aphanizomenon sp. CS-733/32]|uniref:hypothetical protein n=1 Tax=Aphanizomenon sp. CS-733/32 TaxID=3021715 RepID=UPI00233151A0|nr:hypothetical protein [Aphanizomenon sp. CS-733/32]
MSVKRQRNPTKFLIMLGYGYGSYVATQAIATLCERSIAPQRRPEQPNLPDNDFLGLTEQY